MQQVDTGGRRYVAFRFRKNVKIAPGIRLNFSKSGVSTSIGRRGATVNISKRGTRVTAGLPGTGISASKLYRRPAKSAPPAPATKAEWATAMFIGFLLSGGIAYAFSGIRAFMVIVSIACLAVFILLVRKPRSQDPIDVPTIPAASASPRRSNSTWQERAAAVGALVDPSQPTPTRPGDDPRHLLLSSPTIQKDHLALAAVARKRAADAEKQGDFEAAWRAYHDEKTHFMEHALEERFSHENTLSLDATVHERMANLLRKEKRHNEAFAHIIYWVHAQRHRPIKRHVDKFRAYYNRVDAMSVGHDEAWTLTLGAPMLDFRQAQLLVQQWQKSADQK